MRIVLLGIAILALAGLLLTKFKFVVDFIPIKITGEVKVTDLIDGILTLILVVVTICYAMLTAQSVKASEEMAMRMKEANQINLRPYVLIEELSPDSIRALAASDPRNSPKGDFVKTKGYVTAASSDGDYLYYVINNVGSVPAHNIKHEAEIYEIDKPSGEMHSIPQERDTITISECLFPNQTHLRCLKLGKGVIYRQDFQNKIIRIKLKIHYQGIKNLDSNTYFYLAQLRLTPAISPESIGNAFGNVTPELTDEGVEKSEIKHV